MISISCLESKLLNNNNWYGRFQLAPFQKGEGLTVANALRRTLLAEKRAFFITWVDFYNAEIPYSVLTGMRESIFDILLNLKQVIFTSDKVLPNNNHFFKTDSLSLVASNNNFKAPKIKRAYEPLLLNQSVNIVLPMTKQKLISKTLKLQNIKNKKRPRRVNQILCFNKLKHSHVSNLNQKRFITQNVFCENQILGKIVNSKSKTSLRIFHKYNDFTNQLLDTQFSVTSQNDWRVPKKMSDSTYIGYICTKGPTTIYAKNIKLPKGLKCVDPDKYITTLSDDGLFYLRFALTTKIQTSSFTDTTSISNRINEGIKFNRVKFQIFPKTLLNKEIRSCFNGQTDPFVLNQERKSKKSNKYYLNTSQIPFFEFHSNSFPAEPLLKIKRERQTNNSYKEKYRHVQSRAVFFFRPHNAKNSTAPYVPTEKRRPGKKYGSYKEFFPARGLKHWPVHYANNLINEQCLLLTNDSIKQFNFQNTSIIANIQKTCLLNIQIKHYYYKCGRFDRFLFDLIKSFKPNLVSTQYTKPYLKNNKQIFSQDNDWKGLTHFQKIFERQKSNSYLLIYYRRNNVRKAKNTLFSITCFGHRVLNNKTRCAFVLKKKHFMRSSARTDKLSNRFSLQSHVKSFKLEFQTLNTNKLENYLSYSFTPDSLWNKRYKMYEAMGWKLNNLYDHVQHRSAFSSLKWQKIFQSLRTNCIYTYLQKLNTSQATRIYCLLTNSSPESKILLLGSPLILNNDPQAKLLSTTLSSILKNSYLTSDGFSLDNSWSKENIEKQTSQFLFREFFGPPMNKLLPIQKNSDLIMTNEQTRNNLSIFRLHELYLKKFLDVCFLFQCSKNHILCFLRFYILQNNLPYWKQETNFLNHRLSDQREGTSFPAEPLKNILRYSPFKFGLISTEKLITKIRFLRQWSFLDFKYKKQTNISFLNKKTDQRERMINLFPWVKDFFLIRQKKLLELLYFNQNKTLKYDIHLREFFYSKNSLPIIICPSFNLLNDRPKKIGRLFTLKKNQPEAEDQCVNSLQISTNLRAKPSISIQQISYQPVWIFPYQVEKNTDKLLPWSNHLNLSSHKQSLINNSVVLKPIYLNVEQIIYILKQTTKFRKNQRINPVFFDSLTRLKNNKRYPLNYSSLFSKISVRKEPCSFLYNSFFKPYFFNNLVSPYFGFHFFDFSKTQIPSGFFFKNTEFYVRKINQRKTISPYFIDAKTEISNTNYTQTPLCSHVRILGNDFVFKNKSIYPSNEHSFLVNTKKESGRPPELVKTGSGLDGEIKILDTDAELGLRTRNQFSIDYEFLNPTPDYKQLVSYSSNMDKDLNRFFLASSIFSNYFPLFSIKDKFKLRPCEGLSNEPYNINICYSIISFNLRYTYPFKSTIFETFLPFLNFSKNSQPHLKTCKKIGYGLKNSNLALLETITQNNFFSVKAPTYYHNFDYIQYNESFKIYTSLAYTCLKTYEPNLPKYHNFNRRNQKRFQNNGRKVISFKLFESLIQDWACLQKNKNSAAPHAPIFNTKNQKSYHEKSNAFFAYQGYPRPSILNSAYKWRIMNISNFNDAFIIIPCTWFLNFQLYGSRNSTPMFYSSVPPLQKLFYMNYNYTAQNKNENEFFESFGEKKEIIKNRLHWLKTTTKNNELSWLRSYKEKKRNFKVNNKNFDKEDTDHSVNPSTNLKVFKKASFLSTFEQNPGFNFRESIILKSPQGRIKKSIKKLAMNFENIYYKNLLWNSRKITLRILNNAILPLVTNRKYSISNFLPKKNYQTTTFLNMPISFYLNPKLSNRFIWGFKQKIHPYFAPARVFKTDGWSHKSFDTAPAGVLKKSRKKSWLNQSYLFNEFFDRVNSEKEIYHDEKLSFYSLQHKTLGTTNFMCSKTYPIFINENETQSIFKSARAEPRNFSIEIPKKSRFENNFSYTSASPFYNNKIKTLSSTFSNQKIEDFSISLKKRKYLSNLTCLLKPISGEEITNEWYTQKSNDFFSESFSSLRSKWKPFFRGFLKDSQEKTTHFGLPFTDFATQHQKLNENNENSRIKSPLINNLWSSLFFCSYSLYAISTVSDLFFQHLINNDNWTPSTNKIEIPQINSSHYIKNLYDSVRTDEEQGNRKLFFKDSLINPSLWRVNNKMQLQSEQSNQFLNVKPSLKLYYETIQKILKYQDAKLTNYIVPSYDYYWQKAIHLMILSRFQTSKSASSESKKKKIRFNGYKNFNINSFFLQYPKRNINSSSQNSISELKNKYSIRRLKNFERYFGNPIRRHISKNELRFGNILLPIKFSGGAFYKKLTNLKVKKANQQLKSWKSIICTVNENIYFCFRYPLFLQNCNLPWQKSKSVFGMQKNWLNRIKVDLKPLSTLNSSTHLSKTSRQETENINGLANTKLVMTYTQLSSSSNKTHQFLLPNKLWTNIILPIKLDLQTKGSYGMIGYFTVKESLNSIYKVNYIVESQASESKKMAFHSVSSPSNSLTKNPNQSDRFLKPKNSIENFHSMKKFDNIQRDSVNTDALTVSNFLNGTYTFVPSKTIILNSFNELTNSQINKSQVENENEYIQIDIWTNGELSPREALLNAFRKLFELFYNLSKYNCLKPIEI